MVTDADVAADVKTDTDDAAVDTDAVDKSTDDADDSTILDDKDDTDAKDDADDKAEDDDKADTGAPEKYEDFEVPKDARINTDMLSDFTAFAKENAMPQDVAQKIVDMGFKLMQSNVADQAEAYASERSKWVDSVKADNDFGGDTFTETVEGAKRALKQFDPDGELSDILRSPAKGGWGLGDHPGFVKAFARIDKATREDTPPGDGDAPDKSGEETQAEIMYPKK